MTITKKQLLHYYKKKFLISSKCSAHFSIFLQIVLFSHSSEFVKLGGHLSQTSRSNSSQSNKITLRLGDWAGHFITAIPPSSPNISFPTLRCVWGHWKSNITLNIFLKKNFWRLMKAWLQQASYELLSSKANKS